MHEAQFESVGLARVVKRQKHEPRMKTPSAAGRKLNSKVTCNFCDVRPSVCLSVCLGLYNYHFIYSVKRKEFEPASTRTCMQECDEKTDGFVGQVFLYFKEKRFKTTFFFFFFFFFSPLLHFFLATHFWFSSFSLSSRFIEKVFSRTLYGGPCFL